MGVDTGLYRARIGLFGTKLYKLIKNSLDIHSEKCIHMVYRTHSCSFVAGWGSRSESRATNGTMID